MVSRNKDEVEYLEYEHVEAATFTMLCLFSLHVLRLKSLNALRSTVEKIYENLRFMSLQGYLFTQRRQIRLRVETFAGFI